MILTGKEIRSEYRAGNIVIEPYLENMVNPNSYNYHLGDTLKVYQGEVDGELFFEKIVIPKEGYELKPGITYLANTMETLGSNKYAMSLIGRSSIGRLGLFLQVSADLGHTGSNHKWTLELVATRPIVIYSGMKIGQISFWVNDGDWEEYTGLHGKYSEPMESQTYQSINKNHDSNWK